MPDCSLCKVCMNKEKRFPECIPDDIDNDFAINEDIGGFFVLKCKNVAPDLEKAHLCDYCVNTFPTCRPSYIEFGRGIGNDNVIKCESITWASDTVPQNGSDKKEEGI